MIIIVKLNEEQWKIINELKRLSKSYGAEFEIFNTFEETFGKKVVALNGASMWDDKKAKYSKEERIQFYHIIFELPSGKFTVSSQTFNERISIWTNKELNIDKDQIKYYDIPTRQIYENKALNYPNPESMRNSIRRILPEKL